MLNDEIQIKKKYKLKKSKKKNSQTSLFVTTTIKLSSLNGIC
jgi:hypothetical protein